MHGVGRPIIVLDFGAQYSKLIARRVREAKVFSLILPYNAPLDEIRAQDPAGIILSGGPSSVHAEGAPFPDPGVFDLGVPVLGICYGMQLLAQMLGGKVERSTKREYGFAHLSRRNGKGFFDGIANHTQVWMSHGDKVTGLPAGRLLARVRAGESMQLAVLGLILTCGGLALWVGASYLLAAIALGAVLVNTGRGDPRPFDTVQALDWPILALFFILTGAGSHPETLMAIGWLGAIYVAARALGLVTGAWVGGVLGRAPQVQRRWLGPAIMPQAGVALGMALVASDGLTDWGDTILAVVVGSTILFELFGPVLTRVGLSRAGDIPTRLGA